MKRRVAVTFILGLDCIYDCEDAPTSAHPDDVAMAAYLAGPAELPAPIFAIETPVVAIAGRAFSLNAWVALNTPENQSDEVLPETFVAEVDEAARTITVTGRMRRPAAREPNDRPRLQRAQIVGIRATAPAGTYTVRIPAAYFAAESGLPPSLEGDCPPPAADQVLVVGPK